MLLLKAQRGILDKDLTVVGWFSRLLIQSGLRITNNRFLLLIGVVFLAILFGLRLVSFMPLWICLVAAVVLGVLLPVQVVRVIRTGRQAKFSEQLPEALDVLVRSLRSGHPVATAMALVGREMADPAGTEFGISVDEMTYGLDMPRALNNLHDRVGVRDLGLLVTAISLQSGAGGNLSEVLENLSRVLRDRFQLRRKVRAVSAEGRYSAYALAVLPVLIFFAIYLQNHRYYTDVWDRPVFKLTMVGLIIWSMIGDFIMYKMINFKF